MGRWRLSKDQEWRFYYPAQSRTSPVEIFRGVQCRVRPQAEMFRLMLISLAAHLGLLETIKELRQFPCTLTHIHTIDDRLVLGVDSVALDLHGRGELTAFDAQHVWEHLEFLDRLEACHLAVAIRFDAFSQEGVADTRNPVEMIFYSSGCDVLPPPR